MNPYPIDEATSSILDTEYCSKRADFDILSLLGDEDKS